MGYLIFALLALALLSLPIGYLRLCGAMRQAGIQRPPYLHFFFVFAAAGVLVLSIAFLGSVPGVLAAFLAGVVAPVVILVSSCFLYVRHRDSVFHSGAFWSGLAYVGFILLAGLIITFTTS